MISLTECEVTTTTEPVARRTRSRNGNLKMNLTLWYFGNINIFFFCIYLSFSVAGDRRKKKPRKECFERYIYKVLKVVHPDLGISTKAMSIMDSFVNDMFRRVAEEASRLAKYGKRSTITSREIQTAVRLLMPGELAANCLSEGNTKLNKYYSSK